MKSKQKKAFLSGMAHMVSKWGPVLVLEVRGDMLEFVTGAGVSVCVTPRETRLVDSTGTRAVITARNFWEEAQEYARTLNL